MKRREKEIGVIQKRSETYYNDAIAYLTLTKEGKKVWQEEVHRHVRDAKHAQKITKTKLNDIKSQITKSFERIQMLKMQKERRIKSSIVPDDKLDDEMKELEKTLEILTKKLPELENDVSEAGKYGNLLDFEQTARLKEIVRNKEVERAQLEVTLEGRIFARKKKLRRPWDGKMGQDFRKWMKRKEYEEKNPDMTEVSVAADVVDDGEVKFKPFRFHNDDDRNVK